MGIENKTLILMKTLGVFAIAFMAFGLQIPAAAMGGARSCTGS